MIYCDSPNLEEWLAPQQETFPQPTWTKLYADGILLSNSIEFANWIADPVEPIVCEACWNSACSRSGLARIVRIGNYLLWLPPRLSDIDGFWAKMLTDDNLIAQTVLMPIEVWNDLRKKFQHLPAAEHYGIASRADLGVLWLSEMPEAIRSRDLNAIDGRLRESLASDPLDLGMAKEIIKSMVDWILQGPRLTANGRILRTQSSGHPINTIYFDGPEYAEWHAFLVECTLGFAFGKEWAFMNNDIG